MKRLGFFLSCLAMYQAPSALEFFVATNGNDNWSGRIAAPNRTKTDGPFATIDAARNVLTGMKLPEGGVTVWIRKGTYRRNIPFIVEARNSGTQSSPITYAAYKGEEVRICGSKPVTNWKPVTDVTILNRLSKSAAGQVLQADLREEGFSRDELGVFESRGFGRPVMPSHAELFVNDLPMKLSRFPNKGWLNITDAADKGKFNFSSDRPSKWVDPNDVIVHGYWTWDWADSYERVASIDLTKNEIETLPPHGVYGYKKGARFRFLNVLEEIDEPGEYYIDRKSMKIYYWPVTDKFTAELTILGDPLVKADHAQYLRFERMIFENSRSNGLDSIFCKSVLFRGCTFRNLGGYGASIDGVDCGFTSCNITNTGSGGLLIGGGQRKTLDPGRSFAENCEISNVNNWERTYRPGISIAGVGNRISNCRIHDLPHMGILIHGNEHLLEYNEIFEVCRETSDCGAIYIGRDFTERGNTIQYNYIHEIGMNGDVNAVYLDDWTSGTTVYGNVLVSVGRGVMIGGGRDNTVENNIFVDDRPAIHVDARGIGWAKTYFDPKGDRTLFERLDAMNFSKPPFSTKYPILAKILDDNPELPKRNEITRNISVGGRFIDLLDNLKAAGIPVRDNNWDGGDPGFADLGNRDFHITPGSPASKLGFRPLPLERFGLFKDSYRLEIPKVWYKVQR